MEMTFASAVILLLLVMDPFGGVPLFLTALKNVPERRRRIVVLRECGFAFIAMLMFMIFGREFMLLIQVSQTSLGIAGGIILFLIALRLIFPTHEGVFGDLPDGEPFLVPLAIPLLAGPSAFATVMLLSSRYPTRLFDWVLALTVAIVVSAIVLASSSFFNRVLGKRGLAAIERLIGLILTAIAVEMFLTGIKEFASHL